MSRPRETAVLAAKYVAVTAAVGVAGFGTYQYLVKFGQLDPFARFEHKLSTLSADTGMSMSDVTVRQYHKGKLTAKAHVDKATVSLDETSFDLDHIKDGVYESSNGPVHFAARYGSFNSLSNTFTLSSGIHVKGKSFDLHGQMASIDKGKEDVTIPSKVEGQLYGGQFVANNLLFHLKSNDIVGHGIHWHGKPPAGQAPAEVPRDVVGRVWSINGDMETHGETQTFTNAEATDGEVLVDAPSLQHDRKTDVITATGRVTYFSGKADVVADKVVIYRKEKRAEFYGNVLMLVKAKKDQDKAPQKEEIPPVDLNESKVSVKTGDTVTLTPEQKKRYEELRDSKNLKEYPLHIGADKIIYWYEKGSRHATIDGNPRARQEFPDGRWRDGWSKAGTYDGEKEILFLTGDPTKRDAHFRNSIGDMFDAVSVQFSTKEEQAEDDDDMVAKGATGDFIDTSGEDSRASKSTTGTGSPPPPPVKPTGPGNR